MVHSAPANTKKNLELSKTSKETSVRTQKLVETSIPADKKMTDGKLVDAILAEEAHLPLKLEEDAGSGKLPLYCILPLVPRKIQEKQTEKQLEKLIETLEKDAPIFACASAESWLAQGFTGKAGDFIFLMGVQGNETGECGENIGGRQVITGALFCVDRARTPLCFGILAQKLHSKPWYLVNKTSMKDGHLAHDAALGFGLGRYSCQFKQKGNKLKAESRTQSRGGDQGPELCVSKEIYQKVVPILRASTLGRDLINMPANLLGPEKLARRARKALENRGAEVEIIKGSALEKAYPCLAAVGAGSDRPPAVVIARWKAREGAARRLSLVGKGVCFDTGGYDLKPGASMLKMKKDMGGAALMLALACALIEQKADIELEVRLGCVENSISGHAMRPGDVLRTRKGLSVEVGNTDAEGRLILCDLLTEAAESAPDILIDAATLTGAARVALGPDLPALFGNDDALVESLLAAGRKTNDPLWRLPLWHDYNAWLESPIADCNNVSSKPMAGAITAALYLQRFIPKGQKWLHIDSYAWNDVNSPARPKGGETLALRALLAAFGPKDSSLRY